MWFALATFAALGTLATFATLATIRLRMIAYHFVGDSSFKFWDISVYILCTVAAKHRGNRFHTIAHIIDITGKVVCG